MKIRNQLLMLVALAGLTSCAQLSSFQTAKTVGKNNGEIGFAASGAGFTELIDDVDGSTPVLPVIELWGRYGVGEKVDVGLKVSTGLSGVFDGKFQIVGDQYSKFALALGAGLGFQGGTLDNLLLQAHVPLHMSVHPSEKFAVYLTPRYISQFVIGDGSLNYGGASLGFEAGQRVKFCMDVSYFSTFSDVNDANSIFNDFGIGLYQVGLGVKFRIGDN
ncbi:MAG TPA: hypothetical protein P5275_12710 [Saprospiraceae bacterium]|nr:hypothetical protein [Lewinellaceae bacterium]HPG09039.1 hypothetical protein [Saprospiraceae bacterium]HQU53937.1 hypothetical protein [Saprospiraceae bacterium]HRV85722.1 hypothetical protein [Saprospiraceae bacterium]